MVNFLFFKRSKQIQRGFSVRQYRQQKIVVVLLLMVVMVMVMMAKQAVIIRWANVNLTSLF
jgi:hypothetical protein